MLFVLIFTNIFEILLDVVEFNEEHTGVNICYKLEKIFESYQITPKVWFVTTDSGGNIVKGNY